MITYEKVQKDYPGFQVIGIESVWFPGRGWTSWMEIYKLGTEGLSREEILQRSFDQGAEKAQLILATPKGRMIWSDYHRNELLK